jgi:integrase
MSTTSNRRPARSGSLRQRGSTKLWSFQISVFDRDTGRRRLLSRGGFTSKAEAEKSMKSAQVAADKGVLPARARTGTVGEFLSGWLATIDAAVVSGRRKPTTASYHRRVVRLYLIPTLGARPLARLSHADIAAAFATLRQRGGREGRPLSAATVHQAAMTLGKALKAAVVSGQIPINPMARLSDEQRPPGATRNTSVRVWSEEDAQAFATAALADASPPALALVLAMRAGLRRGELCGLRWSDLAVVERADGQRGGTVAIARSVVLVDGMPTMSTPKTLAGHRTIDVGKQVMELLDAARRRQAADRLAAGEGWEGLQAGDPNAPVFRDSLGAPLHPQTFRNVMARVSKAAGVPTRTVHELRHHFGSHAIAQGVPVPVVSAMLGHASPAITMAIYAHALPGSAATYADLLGESYVAKAEA